MTEDYNVMVNSEELIGITENLSHRRGVAQTDVVINRVRLYVHTYTHT
jgi:hypothetical protein